jgi:hypothetical protein
MLGVLAHDDLAMVDYASAARLLLLSDDDAVIREVQAAAERLACRILARPLAAAAEHLNEGGSFDAVFVSIGAKSLPDALLTQLDDAGDRYRCVVQAPANMIDDVAYAGIGPARFQIAEADRGELMDAIAWATDRTSERLSDNAKSANRLQQLSEEAERLATALAAMSELEAEREVSEDRPFDAARVRSIIRARRLRDQFFGTDLFADPAWDMLLDLMAAKLEGQQVAVSSLCIAAAVPATTALRWIKALVDRGLFLRVGDPQDGRRIHIELADEAASALDSYLRTAQRIAAFPG